MNFLKAARIRQDDEKILTDTSLEQEKVEVIIESLFEKYCKRAELDKNQPRLHVSKHIRFLEQTLSRLPQNYSSLDANRTWLCYWICHSLRLLNHDLDSDHKTHIVNFLNNCQCPDGGFGGGPGQAAHVLSTYAAVNALCSLNTKEALAIIKREELKDFLWKRKCPSGAFCVEKGGEVDIRGAYCAVAIATLLNIESEKLFEKTAEWIISCQTYEGGFSGYPGLEAHGGYTFCGFSALVLLNSVHLCDLKSLLRWSVSRQTVYEGGFQGRTNKLVDGCYSFWMGAIFPIIYTMLNKSGSRESSNINKHLFNNLALQEYILICCQNPNGGLLDKPERARDAYHTCYCLSGLSVAQYAPNSQIDRIGCDENVLRPLHPLYNIEQTCLRHALQYFSDSPSV